MQLVFRGLALERQRKREDMKGSITVLTSSIELYSTNYIQNQRSWN